MSIPTSPWGIHMPTTMMNTISINTMRGWI